ncbi:hypothetical protein HPB51_011078 [Rhipicephalus microplus]|uniref:Uncharacterized protein n=1 Tax=Rhipicephalus microplus TaxID=6941 RepID=A0A9J6DUC4_RHIMP|nr:hypothetical protein HPB51_011078 [Rhipicephalus microplus]
MENADTAAGIRSRDLQVSSRVPYTLGHHGRDLVLVQKDKMKQKLHSIRVANRQRGSPRLGRRVATLRRWLPSAQRRSSDAEDDRTAPSLDGKLTQTNNKQTGCRRETQVRGRRAWSHGALGKTPCFSCLASSGRLSVSAALFGRSTKLKARTCGSEQRAVPHHGSSSACPKEGSILLLREVWRPSMHRPESARGAPFFPIEPSAARRHRAHGKTRLRVLTYFQAIWTGIYLHCRQLARTQNFEAALGIAKVVRRAWQQTLTLGIGVFREEITWSSVAHVLARRKQERAVAPRQGLFAGDSKVAARRLVAANRGQERLAHRKQLGHPRPRERRS